MDIKFGKFEELKALISDTITKALKSLNLIPKIEVKEEKIEENPLFFEELKLDIDRVEITKVQNNNVIEEEEFVYQKENESNIRVPEMYPVGLVKGTYIICQNELGMYLIDQHAAKERVNYEFYLKSLGNPKQDTISLLFPINIELPYNEYIIVKENLSILSKINFEIDELGINTLTIRSHPAWLPRGYEEEAIRKIIDLIAVKEKGFNVEKFNESIAITLSCKLSIKANENISINEMEELVDSLRKCENPYTCPHGRPTIIFYSNYELEKMFKRVM
jgi:DNA mismatch repair protein MutL